MLLNRVTNKVANKINQVLYKTFPSVRIQDIFPQDVILHFSYHKCLTVYYNTIMQELASEFGFYRKHFNSDYIKFEKAVLNAEDKMVLSVNNQSDINWGKFPDYKGSHFIRDPRDLIVSGYYYHLWTQEQWCNQLNYNWTPIIEHPYYSQYIESNQEKYPVNISYKTYLNTLEKEKGMILEMIWRQEHFISMFNWNFDNPRIIEFKYEEIVGNEVESFRQIFEHYNFHQRILNKGLKLVEKFSLKNKSKSNTGHIRKGTKGQWSQEFSPFIRELFKQAYGDLLIKLGYENSLNW